MFRTFVVSGLIISTDYVQKKLCHVTDFVS